MLRSVLFCAFTLTAFFTQNALAENGPSPLRQAEGFVIHSSTSVSNLAFTEGSYKDCVLSAAGLEVTRCKLEGAQVTLTSNTGTVLQIPLTDLTYYESSIGEVIYRTYNYKGIWKITQNGKTIESESVLRFNQVSDRDPSILSGYVSIIDLNVSEQIKATMN